MRQVTLRVKPQFFLLRSRLIKMQNACAACDKTAKERLNRRVLRGKRKNSVTTRHTQGKIQYYIMKRDGNWEERKTTRREDKKYEEERQKSKQRIVWFLRQFKRPQNAHTVPTSQPQNLWNSRKEEPRGKSSTFNITLSRPFYPCVLPVLKNDSLELLVL